MKKDTGIASVEGNTIVVNDLDKFNDHLKNITNKMRAKNGETESDELPESDIIIRKGKVKSASIGIEYRTKINGSAADLKLESECIPHPDLGYAMAQLKVHLIQLCDIQEYRELVPGDYDKANNIEVTSFTIGGEAEHQGIVITGFKKIGSKVLNLNTPFTKFDDEFDPYKYSKELCKNVDECINELIEFILNGKCAQVQGEIPFEE